MRKEKLSKKVVTGILATALCATAFTGCGKKAADGMTVLEEKVPQQADSGIYKQANLEGITKEGEYLEFFDYESGRVIAVAHGQDGKRRCVSFKPDGSDIKSFDIAGDGNSMSALFTADKDGNLYMQYQEFSEEKGGAEDEEGVAHAGENDGSPEANGDGENDDASVGDSVPATEEGAEDISYKVSKAFLVKFDTTGKEVLNKDIIDAFSGEETFSVNGLVWTQKNGLLFNTTKGIMKFDENSGLSTVMEISAIHMRDIALYLRERTISFLLRYIESKVRDICATRSILIIRNSAIRSECLMTIIMISSREKAMISMRQTPRHFTDMTARPAKQ